MRPDTRAELADLGYSLLPRDLMPLSEEERGLQPSLAAQWDDLELDRYLKNGARFRERRYDRFRFVPATGELTLKPHVPYFQSGDANSYAGGISRDVGPLSAATLGNPLLLGLLRLDFTHFPVTDHRVEDPWDVQCHQFRIISRRGEAGEPTPEGPHRDEVDYGAIHLMRRTNTRGGESQAYSPSGELLAEFTLNDPMDTMFWADGQILHAVRPITPRDPAQPAVRDVLIFGFKHSPAPA